MKCNSPQKRTVYELSAIQKRCALGGRVAKSPFLEKVCKNSLIRK